jgi:uncharacterized protein
MQIHELTAAECAGVLERTNLGRLACSRLDQPYVVPINYSFDAERGCVYGFSMVGQKIEWMRENYRVCLEIEEITDRNDWTTVLVFGRYEELDRTPEHAEARARAEALFLQRPEWWLPAAAQVKPHLRDRTVVYSIQIDRMTGAARAVPG